LKLIPLSLTESDCLKSSTDLFTRELKSDIIQPVEMIVFIIKIIRYPILVYYKKRSKNMDVQLLIAFIISIVIFPSLLMMLIFKPSFKTENLIKFFKNNRYQKLTYFMYMALVLCILNLILVNSNNNEFLPHIIVIAFFLLIFRKGIAN
jgi:Cu/Ag efflux pump CusA